MKVTLNFEVKQIYIHFVHFFFSLFFDVRVVIDNEACKNATVIRVRVLVSFFGGCVLFSLDHRSRCFLGTKYFIVLQVDSANKHGILLEVVQVLTDLNLIITKAYISSDGGWFMDGDTFPFFDTSFPFFFLFQFNSSIEV